MKSHEFYHEYANTPLAERLRVLTYDHTNPMFGMTLAKVYKEIKKLEDKIRPENIRIGKLLDAYAWHLIKDKDL